MNPIDKAVAAIEKMKGAPLVSCPTVERYPMRLLPLHAAIGGGIPKGRVMLAYGPTDSGKTTLALELIGDVLRGEGRRVVFMDYECALDLDYAAKIIGHASVIAYCTTPQEIRSAWDNDAKRVLVIPPTTYEAGTRVTDLLIDTGGVAMLVTDSIASMLPEDEAVPGEEASGVPIVAKKMATWLPKHKAMCQRTGTVSLFLNQAKKKSYGHIGPAQYAPWTTRGGDAQHFYADIRLLVRGTRSKLFEDVGKRSTVTVKRNKTSRHRGAILQLEITGTNGYAHAEVNLEFAAQHDLVKRATGKGSRGKYICGGRRVTHDKVCEWLSDPDSSLRKELSALTV